MNALGIASKTNMNNLKLPIDDFQILVIYNSSCTFPNGGIQGDL
jgi:hypothetical protein